MRFQIMSDSITYGHAVAIFFLVRSLLGRSQILFWNTNGSSFVKIL
jgi:hypothetical protein